MESPAAAAAVPSTRCGAEGSVPEGMASMASPRLRWGPESSECDAALTGALGRGPRDGAPGVPEDGERLGGMAGGSLTGRLGRMEGILERWNPRGRPWGP